MCLSILSLAKVDDIMEYSEWWLKSTKAWIVRAWGNGSTFDELLVRELHANNLGFRQLARKWDIDLTSLGELIADHCRRLEGITPGIRRI